MIWRIRLSYALVAVFCISIVAFTVPAGRLVTCGDAILPELDPSVAFQHVAWTWNAGGGLGADLSFFRNALFPFIAVDAILVALRFSAVAINHLWLFLIVVLQGVLTVRLIRQLFPDISLVAALVFGGLASVLNPYRLLSLHAVFVSTVLSLAVFPGVLTALLRYLQTRRWSALLEFFFWTAVSATAFNFAVIGVQAAVLVVATAAIVFGRGPDRVAKVRAALAAALIYAGVFAFWYVPSYHWLKSSIEMLAGLQKQYTLDTFTVTAQYTNLWTATRLVGSYLFFNPIGTHPFLPEGRLYNTNALLIVSTSVLPLLAAASLLFVRRYGWRVLWVAGITAAALFIAKGFSPAVFGWLLKHVTIFAALRNSFEKFEWVVVLGYCILAAVAIDGIYRSSKRLGAATIALGFGALGIGAYPILFGNIFWKECFVRIPARYAQVARWLDDHPGRTIQIPVSPTLFDAYSWGYVGSGVNINLTHVPLLTRFYDAGSRGNAEVDDAFQNFETAIGPRGVAPLLGILGFKHVLYDASMRPGYLNDYYSAGMSRAPPGLVPAATFGPIRVYDVDEAHRTPGVYAANELIVGARDLADAARMRRIVPLSRHVAFLTERDATAAGLPVTRIHHVQPGEKGRYSGVLWRQRPIAQTRRAVWTERTLPPEVSGNEWTLPASGEGRAAFADFGDRTVSSDAAAGEALTLAEHGPAVLNAARKTVRYNVCADAGASGIQEIAIPARALGSGTALVALRYRSGGLDPSVAFIDPRDRTRDRRLWLPASPGWRAWSRLFEVPRGATSAYVGLTATAQAHGGCTTFDDLRLGAAPGQAWQLYAGYDVFGLTPPYFARDREKLYLDMDVLEPARADAARSQRELKPIEFEGKWQPPALITIPEDEHYAMAGSPVRVPFPKGTLFRSHGTLSALPSAFDHLLPGGRYTLDIPVLHIAGPVPRVVLFRGNLLLGGATVTRSTEIQHVKIEFRQPGNGSDMLIEAVAGERSRAFTANIFGPPVLTLRDAAPAYYQITRGRTAPAPASLTFTRPDPANLTFHVRGAPSSFLMVFNEGYSPDWDIIAPPNVNAIHLAANLYQNAWVLQGPPNFSARIHYRNQDYAKAGATAGLAAFTLALFLHPGLLGGYATALLGAARPPRRRSRRESETERSHPV